MVKNPQKAYLRTITPKYQTLIDLSVIEILSRHASDEIYLGERDVKFWTSDSRTLQAFQKFGSKPVQLPYTLLHRSSEDGLTFRGIPNSISI